jgi:hypothetical protein
MINRRNALGAGAGALIAGPGLVQGAMEGKDNPSPTMAYEKVQETGLANKIAGHRDWLEERKKELTNTINGQFNSYQIEELEDIRLVEDKIVLNIESLKSVAEQHKRQMKVDKYKENLKKMWIKNAKRELKSILKDRLG